MTRIIGRAARRAAGAALGLGLLAGPAAAQDADALLEKQVRELGIGIGNAYACLSPEDEDARATFRDEAHVLFDLILKDEGSDLAWRYATAVGLGAGVPGEQLDCARLLEQWAEIRRDYALIKDPG